MNLTAVRAEFPIAATHAYLNHASFSPLSSRIVGVLHEHLALMQTQPFEAVRDQVIGVMIDFKTRAARLIGAARDDEIVAVANTAFGINAAALSLPLRAGDNVLVLEGDYPAVIYPWLNLAPRGVLVKWVPQHEGGLDLARLAARIDAHTRVIALSTAMFATGFMNDIAAVGALCRERGIYFVVDGIQTLGAFPLDVQACKIDFLVTGSQKWLLSPPGSGFLYCRHELLDELQPGAYVGATSTVDPFNFLDYNFTLQPDSERFNLGTPNFPGIIGLHAALGMFEEIGIPAIAERIIQLTDILIGDMQERGYRVLSNLAPEHRSGIVIVEVPEPEAAATRLLAANVVTSARGAGLRISPHLYNNEDDMLRVGEVLGNR